MKKYKLSIIIPWRNEMFMARTIEDILEHKEDDTEIIAVLDWAWSNPWIGQHEDVNVIFVPESIWQRAATNIWVRLSRAKFIMKCDAHCSFDQGFDRKMLEAFKESWDNVVMVPTMRNLWAFDWKCYKCGWKKYQWPTPIECPDCWNKNPKYIRRKMIWKWKEKPQSNSFCFDSTPHFQYFNEYTKRDDYKDWDLVETMSLQWSCFMCTKDKYWELNLSDENFGSWWSQGIEVAMKFRLSWWNVLVNKKTWYAHMFRTQWWDFSFPYQQSRKQVENAKKYAKDLFFGNKWEKQIYPLSKIIDKFYPVKWWSDEDIKSLKESEKSIWK